MKTKAKLKNETANDTNTVLVAAAIPQGNHRWKDNKCIHCGITRLKKTFKYLMAITNHPPYDHYLYEQGYIYSDGEQARRERPYCAGRGV